MSVFSADPEIAPGEISLLSIDLFPETEYRYNVSDSEESNDGCEDNSAYVISENRKVHVVYQTVDPENYSQSRYGAGRRE